MTIMGGLNDRMVRDLEGRLFIVNDEKSCTREIGYGDALDYIAKHGRWKNPWKALALHGIKAPSPALKEIVLLEGTVTFIFKAPDGREMITVFRHLHLGASDSLSLAVAHSTEETLASNRMSLIRVTGLGSLFFLSDYRRASA